MSYRISSRPWRAVPLGFQPRSSRFACFDHSYSVGAVGLNYRDVRATWDVCQHTGFLFCSTISKTFSRPCPNIFSVHLSFSKTSDVVMSYRLRRPSAGWPPPSKKFSSSRLTALAYKIQPFLIPYSVYSGLALARPMVERSQKPSFLHTPFNI